MQTPQRMTSQAHTSLEHEGHGLEVPGSFLDSVRTLNIAHRGASAVAPPNTLAAFQKAAELGANGIEFDVRISADGVPVVIHDATVDDTTDGTGRGSEMTLPQLKRLDAGASFDPAFAGERIPTLEEVLQAFGDDLLLNIELKATSLRSDGLERATVALVERYGLTRRVLLSSFNPLCLWRVKRMALEVPVGLLYAPDSPLPLRRGWLAPLLAYEACHPEHSLVDARHVAQIRRMGLRVNTWTVDDPDQMRRLVDLDVDGIITNVPDLLRRVLETTT